MKKVLIDARIVPGKHGGVETFLKGLAEGFSQTNLDIEITFLVYQGQAKWISEYVENQQIRIIQSSVNPSPSLLKTKFLAVLRIVCYILRLDSLIKLCLPLDSNIEAIKPDLLHIPFQATYRYSGKFIFHPHDLQHRHLKMFISLRNRIRRDSSYKAMCLSANIVAVASEWTKRDVARSYGVKLKKIKVIPMAPLTRKKLTFIEGKKFKSLPDKFLLYPSMNWPHKNHKNLLSAISKLKEEGLDVNLVLCGQIDPRCPDPREYVELLKLKEQVAVLGLIEDDELNYLYEKAWAVVVPSVFEAGSFPIFEAFKLRKPVACSNIPPLIEQTKGAALLFDPWNLDSMVNTIRVLWEDFTINSILKDKMKIVARNQTWEASAKEFKEIYGNLLNEN